jgi:hypothetical protein
VFLFDQIVRIINRPGKYTSGKRAASYCGRELAMYVSRSEIRMLEESELMLLRQATLAARVNNSSTADDSGKCNWYVGESGGSQYVRDLSGFANGWRLWNADCGGQEAEAT